MLDYVYGHEALVSSFVSVRMPTGRGRGFGNCRTIGVIENGTLIAGLVYHNFDPEAGTIEISAAALPGKPWMSRETIKRMFQYPFLGCHCQMIINRVDADDERQLFQLARYGYLFTRLVRGLGRDKDLMVCTLTREAWEANKFNARLKHHEGVEIPIEEAA
jgi:hypothetical protein